MEKQQFSPTSEGRDATWSNRILILAVAGILFLTLYPFRFDFHTPSGMVSPFLLGKGVKSSGSYDAFLNVLLFMPFGFGLAEKLRERGRSRSLALVTVLMAGALFSYGIEFSQIYVPERESGWEDVFTNASGSVVGFLLFELFGATLLRLLSACERALQALLSRRWAAFILLLYFGLWFTASILLQRETQLSNWKPDAILVVGNDAAGKGAWSGQVRLVQIWDHAISNADAQRVLSTEDAATGTAGPLASFDFSSSTPLHDQLGFLPDLVWTSRIPPTPETSSVVLDGYSWLSSKVNVPNLVQDLRNSNQFAIRIVCTPAKTNGVDARILSISQPSGVADLNVRQEGAALVFWFRSGISAKKSQLVWHIPEVFRVAETRDFLYSYDGADLSLYIDGKLRPTHYELGPGAALAVFLRRIKPPELAGYNYIYYALVFFPGGVLLGMAARRWPAGEVANYLTFGAVILVIPLLLESLLVLGSGRRFSLGNVVLSIVLFIGGSLWINADRLKTRSAA